MSYELDISVLVGNKITSINVLDNERITFELDNKRTFAMYHTQDCCESVFIHSIVDNLDDITNSEILSAKEEVLCNQDPEWYTHDSSYRDSFTWTIYNIESKKGAVKIVWLGESNGYYSESVHFSEV